MLAAAALVLVSACSGSPTEPSAQTVAGAWLGNSTLSSVSGGECVGNTLQSGVGARDVFMAAIKQSGASLDATVTSKGNGTRCAFTGSAANGSLALNLSACQTGNVVGVRCAGGDVRDLQPISDTLSARVEVAVGTGSGTEVTTWNVLAPGSPAPVGVLRLSADFTLIFLGVPSSDYHVFTGTIFPGYEDGTISIPADPNPFCAKCGWFFP